MDVVRYDESFRAAWDALVETSPSATFQQSRAFLDYHGERFQDRSLVFVQNDRLMAVWPAAQAPDDQSVVISHPGAVHGGLVSGSKVYRIEQFEVLVDAALASWSTEHASFVHKPVPRALVSTPQEAAEYWLWRRDGEVCRCDLWNVMPTTHSFSPTKGIKDNLRIARRAGLEISSLDSEGDLAVFHALLVDCLGERHDAAPVHTHAELVELGVRLGGRQSLWGVWGDGGQLLAATWLFHYAHSTHTQYIASSEKGRRLGAPALLLHGVLEHCRAAGVPMFSFGASTTEGGREVNIGLYRFKAGLGGGSFLHRHLRIDLRLLR